MSMVAPARARTMATTLLENAPGAYCSVMRRRHPEWLLVGPDTDLVIEGYQSCGNTFARKAIQHANPGLRIASHSHRWAHVARGRRLGKPVVVLLRHPLDAVASHAVRMRLADLDGELANYHRFYRRVAAMSSSVVLAPFETTVNRFGDVVRALNARFARQFNVFDHTDPAAVAEVFAEMERDALASPPALDGLWRIARPNEARAEATRAMRRRLADAHGPALARCDALYRRLLRG